MLIPALNLQISAAATRSLDESRDALNEDELHMDESAFRAFYEQTSRPLLRYLVAMTRSSDVAQDLLQESYCRFLTARLPAMDDLQARSYLYRIATNLMHDRWRGPRQEALPESAEAGYSPPVDQRLGVRQAFDRLKPRERQLLWLAYVEGSNHHEIAHSTGLRPGSIRLLLFRARRRLADLIGRKSTESDSQVLK